jgi:hypothetical protein
MAQTGRFHPKPAWLMSLFIQPVSQLSCNTGGAIMELGFVYQSADNSDGVNRAAN